MKRTYLLSLVALLVIVPTFVGCSKRYSNLPPFLAFPIGDPENQSVGRFKTTYLADQIHAYYRGSTNGPLAVATFVDINNLYNSSTFGRLLSEQLISELAMRGYDVLEVRHSETMQIMNDEGEFSLSRDIEMLKDTQQITSLLVGTYAVSPERVYLNVRMIDPRSSIILSSGSVEMPKTDEIERLLRANSYIQSLERIPVRSIGYPTPVPGSPRFYGPSAFEFDMYRYEEGVPSQDKKEENGPALQKQSLPPQASLEPNA